MAESWKPGSKYMNVSQMGAWDKCRYLWDKVYQVGVQPRYERPAISLGDLTHKLLGHFLLGENPEIGVDEWKEQYAKVALTDEEEVQIEATQTTAWGIFERTKKEIDLGHRWTPAVDEDGKKLVEVHFQIEQPVGDYLGFQGYIDWMGIELVNGAAWLIDWKVRKTFQPIDAEEYSMQMACYTKMLRERGLRPVGSMGWQLKSAAARKPKENKPTKKGRSLSKALITTDWETYLATILELGLNPNDYLDMETKLDQIEWSRQSRCYWSEEAIENIWNIEVIPKVSEIGCGQFSRSISHLNCKPCRLRDLCQTDLRGGDVDFLLKTQYKLRSEVNSPLPVWEDDDDVADEVPDPKGEES